MLKAKTRWQLAANDESLTEQIEQIAAACGIAPFVARLMAIRGIDTVDRAKAFLQVSPEQFHDPFLLDGMEKSVQRIKQAIERAELICIYGDYDADGVSSTALMIHLMRQLGATFDYYIPNRFTEGYGLNNEALDQIKDRGFKLVVTVDTGISAVEQAAHAAHIGLDLIITDHHEPPALLPEAYAVINPKKPGCRYPFDMLAGVGVAFKVAHAILGEPPLHLLDLAAIGTISDLVPLVDENRILASLGLRRLNQTRNIGLQALLRVCGLAETEISAGHVGFALGPRINAGGRLETAEAAVKLLASTDMAEAEQYAQTLDQLNRERQELVQQITDEAVAMVLSQYPPEKNGVLVVAKEGWNVGVVGIVASRLVEKFYRPTIVLGIDPAKGTAKGSARSIAGFDMYEALTSCKELLPHYGGHTMAAGMTLPIENLQPLRDALNRLADNWLSPEDFTPITKVDVTLDVEQIDVQVVEQLEALAPFGMGNPTPLVLLRDVEPQGMRVIGRDESHLKCTLAGNGKTVDAIGFQWAHVTAHIAPKARMHVLGELSVNEWNGNRKPQITIRDLAVKQQQVFDWRGSKEKLSKWQLLASDPGTLTITFDEQSCFSLLSRLDGVRTTGAGAAIRYISADANEETLLEEVSRYRTLILYDLPKTRRSFAAVLSRIEQVERLYCLFGDPDASFDLLQFPGRDQFKSLYQFFHQFPQIQKEHLDALARKQQLKRPVLDKMLAVFVELGFIEEAADQFRIHTAPIKRTLESSVLYSQWEEETELATELLLSSYEALLRYLRQKVEIPTA